MDRLEKKCFAASTGSHLLLLCLVVFGSAFYVSKREKAPLESKMRVVPSKMIDDALSGGGGNPNLKPSEELQKGTPDAPKPQPEAPKPEPPKVAPKPEPKPEPVPEPAPEPPPTTKKSTLPLVDVKRPAKPDTKPRNDSILADLKPTKRNDADKRRAQEKAQEKAEAEARERADREWKSQNQKLAKQIGSTVEGLSQGFEKGTVVEAYGPGGVAYANYADWVHQVYDDAWTMSDMMSDQEVVVEVRVVIHRSGRVLSSTIEKRSGNAALDRSVQRALDKVKTLKPFPEGTLDQQRTFNIKFVPKFKRSIG